MAVLLNDVGGATGGAVPGRTSCRYVRSCQTCGFVQRLPSHTVPLFVCTRHMPYALLLCVGTPASVREPRMPLVGWTVAVCWRAGLWRLAPRGRRVLLKEGRPDVAAMRNVRTCVRVRADLPPAMACFCVLIWIVAAMRGHEHTLHAADGLEVATFSLDRHAWTQGAGPGCWVSGLRHRLLACVTTRLSRQEPPASSRG